ncbi:MAG: hypothetical protein ACRETQ_11650 [Gammaproteobacteria bacterium]
MYKIYSLLLLTVFACVASLAQAAPASGLDKIAAYAGTWETEAAHFTTPYSKAGQETATLHNDSWRSGDFYVIHQIVNGKPAPVLSVYTYDAQSDLYHVHSGPLSGDDPGPAGTLIIKGNVWTFPWEYQHAGKTTWFRVVNTWRSTAAIEFREEFSEDQVHWTLMAKGHEVKI